MRAVVRTGYFKCFARMGHGRLMAPGLMTIGAEIAAFPEIDDKSAVAGITDQGHGLCFPQSVVAGVERCVGIVAMLAIYRHGIVNRSGNRPGFNPFDKTVSAMALGAG